MWIEDIITKKFYHSIAIRICIIIIFLPFSSYYNFKFRQKIYFCVRFSLFNRINIGILFVINLPGMKDI